MISEKTGDILDLLFSTLGLFLVEAVFVFISLPDLIEVWQAPEVISKFVILLICAGFLAIVFYVIHQLDVYNRNLTVKELYEFSLEEMNSSIKIFFIDGIIMALIGFCFLCVIAIIYLGILFIIYNLVGMIFSLVIICIIYTVLLISRKPREYYPSASKEPQPRGYLDVFD